MPDTPITQAALDRVENHLRAEIAQSAGHMRELARETDRRYEQRFADSRTAVEAAVTAAGQAVDAALASAKEAVTKAETAYEKRFEGVNEFRDTLGDQQRTLIPRTEAELRFNSNEARLAALEKALAATHGQRTGMTNTWGFVAGAIGLLLAVLGFLASRGGP
jgi:hypothetical protein